MAAPVSAALPDVPLEHGQTTEFAPKPVPPTDQPVQSAGLVDFLNCSNIQAACDSRVINTMEVIQFLLGENQAVAPAPVPVPAAVPAEPPEGPGSFPEYDAAEMSGPFGLGAATRIQ